jgi:sensor histidine kinase YesM
MSKWFSKTRLYPDRLEFCIFAGLLIWIAIVATLDAGNASWQRYGLFVSALLLSQWPVLVWGWKRAGWKKTLATKTYRKYWVGCFCIYLPVLLALTSLMLDGQSEVWEVVVSGAVGTLLLEFVLIANEYYARRVQAAKWVQKLSLEKAVFISITFIALTLSAMAVSSLDNPLYHTEKQLLIGFEFSLFKVVTRFGTFLAFSAQLLLMYLCGYFFFLVNSRVLVAKVLKERGVLLYVLSSLAVVGMFYPVMGQMLLMLPFSKQLGGLFSQNPFIWENAFGAIIIMLISLPVLLAAQWSRQNTLIVSLEKEKAQAELGLLKQQLNPHFFFNTLNNLYALSLQRSQETPEMILQLSYLMRYVIYKAREPFVKIEDEVQYLRDYLQLQSIRLKEKFDLRFETTIDHENFKIAPLLLVVFIENAFKHGIEPAGGNAFLHISLKVHQGKLSFICENSFEPVPGEQRGIGLANLQKRLHLQYPARHRLQIKQENLIFRAELELDHYEDALPDR